jgi:hypothetical protein
MQRDIGAVATNPAKAPLRSLWSEGSELEEYGTARIKSMTNYTGFMSASQGGKHLLPLRESPINGIMPASISTKWSIGMTDIL